MRILVLWDASRAERATLEASGFDVAYARDGARPEPGDGVVAFWPKKELREAGLHWSDLHEAAWIKLVTAGVNHVGWSDVPEDLPVLSTPGATGSIIAEYALGAIIAWARGFQRHTEAIRAGRFVMGAPARGLSELHVGLVGYGGIGSAIAKVLAPTGATVSAVSRSGKSPKSDQLSSLQTLDGLVDMAAAADVLVTCLPLNNDTKGLIDAEVLEALGDGLLLNVARGHVVDEQALHAWLSQRPEAHAHLDVWWQYPKDGGHPFHADFASLPNVTMTPHNSPNVSGHRVTMLQRALQDIRADAQQGTLRHRESPDAYFMDIQGDGRFQ